MRYRILVFNPGLRSNRPGSADLVHLTLIRPRRSVILVTLVPKAKFPYNQSIVVKAQVIFPDLKLGDSHSNLGYQRHRSPHQCDSQEHPLEIESNIHPLSLLASKARVSGFRQPLDWRSGRISANVDRNSPGFVRWRNSKSGI